MERRTKRPSFIAKCLIFFIIACGIFLYETAPAIVFPENEMISARWWPLLPATAAVLVMVYLTGLPPPIKIRSLSP